MAGDSVRECLFERCSWLVKDKRPRYKDVAGAVKERCIFMSCPNHRLRGERDPQLFAKVRGEIGAFAATCIELAGGYWHADSIQ